MNKVILEGELAYDADLRAAGSQMVLNIKLKVTDQVTKGDGSTVSRWGIHTVKVWGPQGEKLAREIGRGTRLRVEGRLNSGSYDDKKTGAKVYFTEVVADTASITGGQRQASLPSQSTDDSDIPF